MGSSAEGYIKEFTRHSSDMLLNLNELRKREILTDVTLLVGEEQFKAHKAVLIACSGFFYSIFSEQSRGGVSMLPLPSGVEPRGFQVVLEFMYTSRLFLSVDSVRAVLAAAMYLKMEHVVETCRKFIQSSSERVNGYLKPLKAEATEMLPPLFRSCRESLPPETKVLSVDGRGFPLGVYIPSPTGCSHLHTVGDGYFRGSVVRFQEGGALTPVVLGGSPQDRLGSYPKQIRPIEEMQPKFAKNASYENMLLPLDPERPQARPQANVGEPQSDKENNRQALRGKKETQSWIDHPLGRRESPVCGPESPMRSEGQPNSPTESCSAVMSRGEDSAPKTPPSADPKACNWKKYKYIILNSLNQGVKEERECRKPRDRSPTAVSCSPPGYGQSADRGGCTSDGSNSGEEMDGIQASQTSQLNSILGRISPVPSEQAALHQCNICGLRFKRVTQLCHHVTVSHPGEDLPEQQSDLSDSGSDAGLFSCTACKVKFSEEETLRRHHLQVHSEDKPYRCDMCHAAFRYKGNLASHKSIHTGEKPYRCSVCGAQFNRPANLKTHSRIHSGEKPYKCETCGARFVQVAHLRAHVLIHTGEKPYPCDTCGTRFRHLQTLKSHIRIHTGEKPYHCEKCDLHFRHKSQLRLHLRQKHGAITNTKIHYKVMSEAFAVAVESC
ncbi:B-cell CLL/lymphoma 6 member B protein isoform X1 [Latimeria chalumnae]|uniref:B-cell CLL/lymphoma 6 member B protein isoform X1 n=1 Tax=Latimeria chalumnae TaxID=7897 RepID=UPI0006D93CEE|nr:PREDICTED: B-cell CLL/lymphoma 6 member B protein [Latimeria chalumnae]XP_014346158.1 PREDICTED: B-cell CLL/lymphoma 6 member B protein [Latimeria chalumnae]|eukprot:XP_014346157.1 PREDICTED: B-cell CLL/lymphoma 6 member B protein [Latimeria chalumnae]